MDEDNLYPKEDGRISEEQEQYMGDTQQGIYKEGTHQQQGEYRDLESDFRKPEYEQDVWQSYRQPYQEPYQPVSQGFGIASLVLGIASLVLFCSCINLPLAILAIVFGIVQLAKQDSPKGMAIGGIVTAVISLVSFAVFCIAIWGSVDFREGFQRGLERSIEEQLEDGYLDDFDFPYEEDDRLWDEEDDEPFEDEMDTF